MIGFVMMTVVVVYKLINDGIVALINNVEDDAYIVPFEDLLKRQCLINFNNLTLLGE
jgi:hypothetical protein